jgi:intein/homing endonuclease
MISNISKEDIEFCEFLYNPLCFSEAMFTNYDNLAFFEEGKLGHIRLGQIPLLSFEYLIDENPKLSDKQNFALKIGAGDSYVLGGRNFGKCEWEENLCTLYDGREVKFKDLVGTEKYVLSLNPITLKLEKSLAIFSDNGIRDCIKVTTSKGKEITVTENHPLFSQYGWKEVKDLKVGDFLVTPRKYNIQGNKIPKKYIPELLGYLLGDGSCTNQIGFTNINEELISEFLKIAEYLDCRYRKDDITYYVSKKDNSSHNHKKSKIHEIVLKYRINKKSTVKTIPEEVFSWKNKYIAVLLNRYFACDGHVNVSGKNHIIELCSMSKIMLFQVQSLLLRFGIQSLIGKNRLFITEDFDKFLDLIGIKSKDNVKRWNKKYTTTDTIPVEFVKRFLKRKKEFYYKSVSCEKLLRKYKNNLEVEKIVNSDIYWDVIKKIEKIKSLNTVAVSVPLYYNYISNNIISHNTLCEKIDMLNSFVLCDGYPMGITSYDAVHIRGVMEPVIGCLETHPIMSCFKERIKRSPTYLITSKNNALIEGINMNISNKNPGNQFFQKHFKKLWVEEACVDAHTKVRCLEDNKIYTKNISEIVNSDLWKKIKVLSYNYTTKILEWKKIKNIFKNKVKDYINYKITVSPNSEHSKRTLIVSQKQKIWTDKGYKYIDDINKNDNVYLSQYSSLSKIQKELLVGCLLGDAYLTKDTNCKLVFTQGKKQENYFNYKKKCFYNIFQTKKRRKNKEFERLINSISESKAKIFRASSVPNIDLNEFRDFKYNKINNSYRDINKKILNKYFSEISLAFWFMDDGSTKICKNGRVNVRLHTNGFSLNSQKILKKILFDRFKIDCNICGDKYYYLSFDKVNSKKILDIVSKYLTEDLLYKTNIKAKFIDLIDCKYNLAPIKIEKIEKILNSSWTMYDIEVEDNHNFFANEILISNSFETEEVYKKRIDSRHEAGCIQRISGMTNFTKYSPAGRIYYDYSKRPWVMNIPQYVNPFWDDLEKEKAIKKHGGENCFDESTEILTNNGWKNYSSISYDDKVFSMNLDNEKASYEAIDNIFIYDYDDYLYNYTSNNINFSFTKNHDIVRKVLKTGKLKKQPLKYFIENKPIKKQFSLKESLNCLTCNKKLNKKLLQTNFCSRACQNSYMGWEYYPVEKFVVKNVFDWDKNPLPLNFIIEDTDSPNARKFNLNINDWLRFLGWFVSEGHVSTVNVKGRGYPTFYTSITQTKSEEYRDEIQKTIAEMGFKVKFGKEKITIGSRAITKYLMDNCYNGDFVKIKTVYNSHNKVVPSFIKSCSKEQILIFLNAFFKGDGNGCIFKNAGNSRICWTCSKKLADDLQELCLKAGFYCKVSKRRDKNIYRITINNSYENAYVRIKNIEKVPYKGKVWCVETNPYNTIFVRRNGTCHWTGNSIGYRIFVKGEVVEEGVSVFDMERIRPNYLEGKKLKTFEVTKKTFGRFTDILLVEPPSNASQMFLCADIGEAAPTEMVVLAKINEKYRLIYNITLYGLTDKEQFKVFKHLIDILKINFTGIDTTDGTGRAIFRSLEEIIPRDNLVWVAFNEKISVDFDRNEKGIVVFKDGKPAYKEEYVSEWSVRNLKTILYDNKIEIPEDSYKFDTQLNSVISMQSGNRTVYECVADEDHLFQAFQVFSIAQWMNEFNLIKPANIKKFCKFGAN